VVCSWFCWVCVVGLWFWFGLLVCVCGSVDFGFGFCVHNVYVVGLRVSCLGLEYELEGFV
jgi:hypothetical protein